jgi:hypothetical protein
MSGIPASEHGDALADLVAVDYDVDRPRGVHMQLIDQALAEGRRSGPGPTVQEVWVEDSSFTGGHWERL